jgi:ATP-binding cassette subfamily F protein 3
MLVCANRLTKLYGQKDILLEASFHINPGEKIGLVGPNGAGKSTLLKLILGEVEPDGGEIHRAKHVRIGYLPQNVLSFRGKTVMEEVLDVAQEVRWLQEEMEKLHEEISQAKGEIRERLAFRLGQLMERYQHLGGYGLKSKAEKILVGLGFREEDFSRPVESLSGGWIMRVALARLLLSDADLLLLDEPTNHLDIEALKWLEGFLEELEAAVVVVSHDRRFLNKVVERILEIDGGQLLSYKGNFDTYREEKRRRIEQRWAAYKLQQERLKQLERFIERNRARKDRARQVQSRLKALEKMEIVEPPREPHEMRFRLPEMAPLPRIPLELHDIWFSYCERPVFRGVSLVLERGERLAVVGPNGAGKSTLLKIMAGELSPQRGSRRVGQGVRIGFFAQDQLHQLNPEKTVLEELMDSVAHPHQGELRNFLALFHFRGDEVFKRVGVLSGGEQARLLLCKVLLGGANLLLLDEPTNHLDISSREALEETLIGFGGALVLVTHDREMMGRVATRVLEVGTERVELFLGPYGEFEASREKRGKDLAIRGEKSQGQVRKDKERKRLEAEWRNRLFRMRVPLEKEIESLEEQVERATSRIEEIQKEMSNPELYRSGERVRELKREMAQLRAHVQACTERWEELQLELEALKKGGGRSESEGNR